MSTATGPDLHSPPLQQGDSIIAAPALPEIIAVPKRRGPILTFVRRHPMIALGGALLAIMVMIGLFAPYLGTVDPARLAPSRRIRGPSGANWFGTDMLGRDIYSRVMYGARVSLTVGFSVALLSSVTGMLIGAVSGYFRLIDAVAMRVMDGLMSIPSVLLAIALMALTRGSVLNVIVAVTISEIPRVSRLIRSVVLSLREQPYVEAAIA
ncbi:MAG: ABC transporter permease, partial [Acetobacteraceae bacterium]|nr:ABC transporter permease [Acetobacteraceae bacterium]